MQLPDLASSDVLRTALLIAAAIFGLWIFGKLLRLILIFVILGFIAWHFWLS